MQMSYVKLIGMFFGDTSQRVAMTALGLVLVIAQWRFSAPLHYLFSCCSVIVISAGVQLIIFSMYVAHVDRHPMLPPWPPARGRLHLHT